MKASFFASVAGISCHNSGIGAMLKSNLLVDIQMGSMFLKSIYSNMMYGIFVNVMQRETSG
jgi:hypothetical protein